jgi:anaerobic magnesium-protoporphyrin IX monomethyl ester cyclase
MRVVLADLRSSDGFVSKDTVAGGYGSRLRPFSHVTRVMCSIKRRTHDVPSVHLGYLAALAADAGHEVVWTRGPIVDGDVALVLSSLVEHRDETAWADAARRRGTRVGFIGLAASKLPELFAGHADFVVRGEPEAAMMRIVAGEDVGAMCESPAIQDLDSLPFPRWDGATTRVNGWRVPFGGRPTGGAVQVLSSRGCPEHCTYCPHRILAGHRQRSVENVVAELMELQARFGSPYVVFRDPLFSADRDRCLAFCDAVRSRGLKLRFECETRLDRLDDPLLETLHAAGLRAMSFGVETVATETLRRVARRPIPPDHQRRVVATCRRLGIVTAGFYVFGFMQDTWESIAATIDYAAELGSTFAQFKLLTPYPGTPLWTQMSSRVYETDWQRFDGFTPTFHHPTLSPEELQFLLGAAYARFYVRPSYLGAYFRVPSERVQGWLRRADRRVYARQARREQALMSRAVSC